MTQVRIDKVHTSSLHESFKNYDSRSASITVRGTISGNTSFSTSIPYARSGTVAEIYVQKSGSSYKRLVDNLPNLPEYGGSTDAYITASYSATTVTVTILVVNFGAPYIAPTETYDIELRLFDAPIT